MDQMLLRWLSLNALDAVVSTNCLTLYTDRRGKSGGARDQVESSKCFLAASNPKEGKAAETPKECPLDQRDQKEPRPEPACELEEVAPWGSPHENWEKSKSRSKPGHPSRADGIQRYLSMVSEGY